MSLIPSLVFYFGTFCEDERFLFVTQEIKMKNITRLMTVAIITSFALTATACNTIQGVGEDLNSAGQKAEEITKK